MPHEHQGGVSRAVCLEHARMAAIETARHRALVELHGGWAEVESEPGKGATFILHLPLRADPVNAPPELVLEDGGAAHIAQTIRAVRRKAPDTTIEVLTPDFRGQETVCGADHTWQGKGDHFTATLPKERHVAISTRDNDQLGA